MRLEKRGKEIGTHALPHGRWRAKPNCFLLSMYRSCLKTQRKQHFQIHPLPISKATSFPETKINSIVKRQQIVTGNGFAPYSITTNKIERPISQGFKISFDGYSSGTRSKPCKPFVQRRIEPEFYPAFCL